MGITIDLGPLGGFSMGDGQVQVRPPQGGVIFNGNTPNGAYRDAAQYQMNEQQMTSNGPSGPQSLFTLRHYGGSVGVGDSDTNSSYPFIRQMQSVLQSIGYPVPQTGNICGRTAGGIEEFRERNGLPPNGGRYDGPMSWVLEQCASGQRRCG